MRNAIVTLSYFCIFISINSCNQSAVKTTGDNETGSYEKQQPDFTGIYEFQIDKTTVGDLKKLPYHIEEITVKDAITETIKSLGPDGVTDWDLLCNGVRKFKVHDFTNGTISFWSVKLIFYNDTLSEFTCLADRGIFSVLAAKYLNYTGTYEDGSIVHWHNGRITASCTTYDTDSDIFYIYDFLEKHKIRAQMETAKADYLKKMNANM